VLDTRLSNTATHADQTGSPPIRESDTAILLAIASHLIQEGRYDREFVRRFWNWREYSRREPRAPPVAFEAFEAALRELYAPYTFEFAAKESGVEVGAIEAVHAWSRQPERGLSTARLAQRGGRRAGGWQVSRAAVMLNALMGAIATEGGTFPNGGTSSCRSPSTARRTPMRGTS